MTNELDIQLAKIRNTAKELANLIDEVTGRKSADTEEVVSAIDEDVEVSPYRTDIRALGYTEEQYNRRKGE